MIYGYVIIKGKARIQWGVNYRGVNNTLIYRDASILGETIHVLYRNPMYRL
jgi:hypothetical protein